MTGNSAERKSRVLEVGLAIVAAVVTSALTMYLSLPVTMAEVRAKQGEHDRSLAALTTETRALAVQNAAQDAQLAVQQSQYGQVKDDLTEIKATLLEIQRDLRRRQ